MTVVSAEAAEQNQKKDTKYVRLLSKTKRKIPNMLLPILAEIAGSIHVGLAALGAAVGVGLIGMGASSAVGRNPGAATPILVQAILAIAFTEAIVFYALFLVK